MPVPGRSALLSLLMLCVLCVPPMAGCFRDPPAPILGDPGTATGVTSWPGSSSETGAATGHDATSDVTGGVTGDLTSTSTSTSTGTGSEGSSTSGAVETTSETTCALEVWYRDLDLDGHGDPQTSQLACSQPRGYVAIGDDCDDDDGARAPSLPEICDQQDNDCDPLVDEYSPENTKCGNCVLGGSGTSSYAYCLFERPFQDARLQCQARGGDLTVIEDEAENAIHALQALTLGGETSRWYIGINDIEVEGDFVWLDGAAVGFTRWGPGEPNDQGDEDCGVLYGGDSSWNDQDCGVDSVFICEAVVDP